MNVRRLVLSDLDEYFALRLEMLQDSPAAFLTTYEDEKAKGNAFFADLLGRMPADNALFGAFVDGRLVGAAGVYRESDRAKLAHKATLWGMYVQPAARGRGLGEAIVSAVIAHARKEIGAAALYLTVEGENRKARALYERMGFRVWGTEPKATFENGAYREDHHLWLDLGSV